MTVPTIELSGDALAGITPHLLTAQQLAALPSHVKLGRIRPDRSKLDAPHLANYLDESRLSAPPPAAINRRDKAAPSIARMYLNDKLGDCVIASSWHLYGVLSANDSDSLGIALATDAEVQSQYVTICGPGDRGCVMTDVLEYMVQKGLTGNGVNHKLYGFVQADWTNQLLVQTGLYLLGAGKIGLNLPQAWQSAAIWDVTSTPIVGGHDVCIIDYDASGVYVASWGRIYLITWRAFMSRKWLEECYFTLSDLWYGDDGIASACGLDVATLKADLSLIGKGKLPPIPDPNGPPPPPPVVGSGIVRVDTQAKVVTIDPDWKVVVRS